MLHILLIISLSANALILPIKKTQIQKSLKPSSSLPSGSISLDYTPTKNYFDVQYYSEFYFGTPKQLLSLILDTGSSLTWVPSITCSCHLTDHVFDASKSSTFVNTSLPEYIQYGKGRVEGFLFKDTVSVEDLVAIGQDLLLVEKEEEGDGLQSDGLLGLAFKELSNGMNTFVDNLKAQGAINASVFSFYLTQFNDDKEGSVFSIGEYDLDLYGNGVEQIIHIDGNNGFWTAKTENFFVGQTNISTYGMLSIIDSGTSNIIIPTYMYAKYVEEVKKYNNNCQDVGILKCSCGYLSAKEFPDFKFRLNGEEFVIHAENYVYFDSNRNVCYLSVSGSNYGFILLGQPFFREFYTVFDMDNKLIRVSQAFKFKDNNKNMQIYMVIGMILVSLIGATTVLLIIRERDNSYLRIF